jgi:hypothetical protein
MGETRTHREVCVVAASRLTVVFGPPAA